MTPLVGVIGAPFALWGWGFHWTDLGVLIGMYLITSLGITVGYHRLFVHRSFDTYMWKKFIWAVFGSMAMQGTLIQWVAVHRRHHQMSDTPDDPHTPHTGGWGIWGMITGFLHAHVGWMFLRDVDNIERYATDLKRNKTLRVASDLFVVWVALGLFIPALIGGLITMSWVGVLTGLIWGGFVRIFLVHHVTWSINSACHMWGLRLYKSEDHSRDNLLFGILAMGEGWHNSHHAFPNSVRHGLRWWQIDVSYYVVRVMWMFGLTWNLKMPTREAMKKEAIAS